MDNYHSFRGHMAYDIRRGIVSSNPVDLVDHAAEWVERFLSDVQRHRERRASSGSST